MNPSVPISRIGPMSGRAILGEVTESVHRFLLEGYDLTDQPPRFEEDIKFSPKDREEVVYIYMYRVAQNTNLQRQKRWTQAPVFMNADPEEGGEVFYHRPPLLLDLFYLVMVHSKFRSDAERLMGWVMLRLHEATHLVYRPRRFLLPDGREVDSLGRTYDPNCATEDPNLLMEKVSLALVDDLTVGDAINFFSLHEAPYRPFLTYRARVALDGPLAASAGGTTVRMERLEPITDRASADRAAAGGPNSPQSPNGRIRSGRSPQKPQSLPGPAPYFLRRNADADTED